MTFTSRAIVAPAVVLLAAGASFGQTIGPSTTTVPYVLPTPGYGNLVRTISVLTVGDTINGYSMVGIPDGLGAFSNGNGSFTLTMNHELGSAAGATRAHGSAGSFVSQWNIQNDLTVTAGRDQTTSASNTYNWDGNTWVAGTTAWNRFCSADMAAPSAYRFGNLGTDARIHLNGEEAGAEGRAYAHVITGTGADTSWQLPHLGRSSWENQVANPFAQARTIVAGLDDSSSNGGVYFYVGNKTATGNDIERAGLTSGNQYGVRVQGMTQENRNTPPAAGTRFDLFNFGNVSNTTGAQLDSTGAANGVTSFLRPEDGAWDPRPGHQNDFYFVTTDRFNSPSQAGRSRLWRMRFDDITNPTAGGTVDALLTGTEGQNMFDNICIDQHGRILLQEDIGNADPLGKLWIYDINTAGFGQLAAHNADLFTPGSSHFLTADEESSGIIDASEMLGDGWFLFDVQAHYANGAELVEGGQLLAMYVDPSVVPTPGAGLLLVAGGSIIATRRRR